MADVIFSDRVEGTTVYNTVGEKLGTIDDLKIDKISGQVRHAVLEFGGFLGVGTDRYPMPWSMLKYDTSLGGYVVPLDEAQLVGAPGYGTVGIPDYDDMYRAGVTSTTDFDGSWASMTLRKVARHRLPAEAPRPRSRSGACACR